MRRRCSWVLGGQILKCDQNFGRYYFNFPAPCSLPILFSAAWCNNKCYLDPILRGSRWPGMMIHLSDRPRPISWRCLWVFLSRAEPGQSKLSRTYLFVTMSYEAQYHFLPPRAERDSNYLNIDSPGHWSLSANILTNYNLILQYYKSTPVLAHSISNFLIGYLIDGRREDF